MTWVTVMRVSWWLKEELPMPWKEESVVAQVDFRLPNTLAPGNDQGPRQNE